MTISGAGENPTLPGSASLAPAPLHWVVYDLETSGLESPIDIYVAVLWSSKTNWPVYFTGAQVHQLASALESADVVVSYNGKGYDRAVVEGAVERRLKLKSQIDLYEEISARRPAFERGWKLDDVAHRLWGVGKQLESAAIPGLWQQGERDLVIRHAMQDVYLTRCLFEQVRDKGWVVGPDNSNVEVPCPNWWKSRLQSMSDVAPNVASLSL